MKSSRVLCFIDKIKAELAMGRIDKIINQQHEHRYLVSKVRIKKLSKLNNNN